MTDQEKTSLGVVGPANVIADSQDIISCETNGKSSAEKPLVVKPTFSRVKRAKNEEECEQQRSWDVQVSINWVQNPSPESRDVSTTAKKKQFWSSRGNRNRQRTIPSDSFIWRADGS